MSEVSQVAPSKWWKRSRAGDTLRFYIIFMRGQARRMTLFTLSLLDWSDECEFVMVPNGCSKVDRRLMRTLADRHRRLRYLELASVGSGAHAAVLHQLLALERGHRFCFLDNDILADGPFLPPLLTASESHAGVFACPPIWATSEDKVHRTDWRRLGARSLVTDTGMVVGGTYLAMYDAAPLRMMVSAGGRFDRASWEDLSNSVRADLRALGMRKDGYETGKVLNLMLLSSGRSLVQVDIPGLHHVGGMSVLKQLPGSGDSAERPKTAQLSMAADQRELFVRGHARREASVTYVDQLLSHLFDRSPTPATVRTGDDALDERLSRLADALGGAYSRHADELDRGG